MNGMLEIRWHGRGGQGVWTASELLAIAAVREGKYVQSFPEFGPERMGAPVTAFTRVSVKPIRVHCAIYNPDVVVVLDPTLMKAIPIVNGVKDDGIVVINSKDEPIKVKETLGVSKVKVWAVPATEIAIRVLGVPITNTTMLGAVARATGIVSLESLEKAVKGRFNHEAAEKNFEAVKEAYERVKVA